MPVAGVDSLQAVGPVEGAICGEDGVYSTVDRESGKDSIASVEPVVGRKEVDPALYVIGL